MPEMTDTQRKFLKERFRSLTPISKRICIAVLCAALLLVAGASATIAFVMIKDNNNAVSDTFLPATVECEVKCTQNGGDYKFTVQNKGNVDAYIRVKYLTRWISNDGTTVHWKQPNMDGCLNPKASWGLKASTYYYTLRVGAGQTTTAVVITDPTTNGKDTAPDGYKFSVTAVAEAIQADGTTAGGVPAVENAWGTHVSVKDDGTLKMK